jgi:hypothetical protein
VVKKIDGESRFRGVDFLSKVVVKIYFREKPTMVEWRTSESIGLKRVEIQGYPLMA